MLDHKGKLAQNELVRNKRIAGSFSKHVKGSSPRPSSADSQNWRHSAKATYSPLRRWGQWQRDGPTHTSITIVHPNKYESAT
eukprot:5148822-Pleurochrysis_carterae.AAC.1